MGIHDNANCPRLKGILLLCKASSGWLCMSVNDLGIMNWRPEMTMHTGRQGMEFYSMIVDTSRRLWLYPAACMFPAPAHTPSGHPETGVVLNVPSRSVVTHILHARNIVDRLRQLM